MLRLALLAGLGAAGGFLLHGPWAAAGVAAGAAAAVHLLRAGAGPSAAAFALAGAPLFAAGPASLAVAALLALVVVARATSPLALVAAAAGPLVPLPGMALLPLGAGAVLVAIAPDRRSLLVGALLGFASGLGGVVLAALAPAAAAVGLATRWVQGHPANVTVATTLARIGLALAPVPALAGWLLASFDIGPTTRGAVFGAAVLAALGGTWLLAAHVGLAVARRADAGIGAEASAMLWVLPVWLAGIVASAGVRAGLADGVAALLLGVVAAGIGGASLMNRFTFLPGRRGGPSSTRNRH
jgi:hypothetical protein